MSNYLIVGASSGIGQAIAEKLADAGHDVYATYHSHEVNSDSINYHQLDVLGDVDLDFLPDTLEGIAYCPGSINLLPFARIKPEQFTQDYQLQVVGAVKVLHAAMDALKKADHASVVLFSTVAVQSGFNFHSQVSSSKGAIEGLAKALAAEFAPKIRVNAVAPSLIDTPLASKMLNTDQKREANAERHPLKRIGSVTDIAEAATFLLSEKSSWITGQVISVDGGIGGIRQ